MDKKEANLRSREELLQGRIDAARKKADADAGRNSARFGVKPKGKDQKDLKERLRRIREKKGRLAYQVQRLEMQVEQKRRELRKSGVHNLRGGLSGSGAMDYEY